MKSKRRCRRASEPWSTATPIFSCCLIKGRGQLLPFLSGQVDPIAHLWHIQSKP